MQTGSSIAIQRISSHSGLEVVVQHTHVHTKSFMAYSSAINRNRRCIMFENKKAVCNFSITTVFLPSWRPVTLFFVFLSLMTSLRCSNSQTSVRSLLQKKRLYLSRCTPSGSLSLRCNIFPLKYFNSLSPRKSLLPLNLHITLFINCLKWSH